MPREEPISARREFFRDVARWVGVGAAGVVGLVTTTRRPGARQTCISDGICRSCSSVERCGLPQAMSYRQARGGDGG